MNCCDRGVMAAKMEALELGRDLSELCEKTPEEIANNLFRWFLRNLFLTGKDHAFPYSGLRLNSSRDL